MSHTRVVNFKHFNFNKIIFENPDYIYIGRPGPFGNPFASKASRLQDTIYVSSDKIAVICFSNWILGITHQNVFPDKRQYILNNLHLLKDKTLVCWCTPNPCHGEILRDLADGKIKPEETEIPV